MGIRRDIMRFTWKKFSIFSITIISISIVVFNNLAQVVREIFIPTLNIKLWFGFGLAVLTVITYAVLNKDMLIKN